MKDYILTFTIDEMKRLCSIPEYAKAQKQVAQFVGKAKLSVEDEKIFSEAMRNMRMIEANVGITGKKVSTKGLIR